MNKIRIIKINIFSLCLFLFMFISCNNGNNFFQKSVSFPKLLLFIDSPENDNYSRTAIPDFKINTDTTSDWTFTLENTETLEKYIFYSYDLQYFDEKYTIPISSGLWNISVCNQFYYGNVSAFFVDNDGQYDLYIKVYPITSDSGNVNLKIETGNSGITKVRISQSNTILDDFYIVDDNNTISIHEDNIPSGNYSVALSFFIEDTYIFSLPEIINIRKNFTTNKWILNQNDNNQLNYINDDKICLSKEALNFFCGNIFYVKGENGILQTFSTDYELPDGSFLSPFSSVQEAIDKIIKINDGLSTYIIYIDGIITDNSEYSYSISNNLAYINIFSEIPLKIKIQGLSKNAKININRNFEKQGRLLYISGKSFIEIINLELSGGYISENGGGIYLSTEIDSNVNFVELNDENQNSLSRNYNLIISGNTKIYNNYTEDSGGGIYVDNGYILIKDESSISENTALTKGGGICILGLSNKENRVLDIDGCRIEKNISLSKSEKNGAGGGLYTQFAIVNIQNCIFSKNKAANGGGIDIAQNSIIYITNSTISENYAVYEKGKGGGGVFATGVSSKLYLKKNCKFSDNISATNSGGGIRITSTDVHIFDFVYIMNNYYKNQEIKIQDNLSLADNKKITIDEKLSETKIGINTSSLDEIITNIVFTKSYGTNNQIEKSDNLQTENLYENPNLFFFSDNNNYFIKLNEKSECELYLSS